jgi:heat shock protein HtpX
MGKRILLFILTNVMVITTLSIVINLLGIRPYITHAGLDLRALAGFAIIYGFGGALISLALSRQMAKWMQGVQVIDPNSPGEFSWLVQTVHDLARKAKLPAMPEVGVYDSADINAFATGPTKARSLVAVSTGLLSRMNRDEIEGVLGHEIAHIQNGDMVTMTLLQGVVNAFSIFLARVIAYAVAQAMSSRDEEGDVSPVVFHLVAFVCDIFITFLGSLVVSWFSRQREFRADAGSARLTGGVHDMKAALCALARLHGDPESTQPALAAMKISSGGDREKGSGFNLLALMSTHPPLSERIARLERREAQGTII